MGRKEALGDKVMNNYANDPFFIKKREEAVKFHKKAGLPDSFTRKK